jgi:NAD(P)-dependent dehydrogenase (short-subunit alcohol dehydrogenase family)
VTAPRAVVVTGGTGALGRAVVAELLRRGARVTVTYTQARGWEELRSALGGPGALDGVAVDLTDAAAARRAVDDAAGRHGGLDGLACLAGAWSGGAPFEAAPEDEWTRMLEANLVTARNACRAALPHLLRGGGAIVTIGSSAAASAGAGAAAYAVAKSAVHALTRVLALENRERGVRVNAVLPGTMDTPANRRAMPKADPSSWTPTEAVARIVVFLLGPESAPMTGALLPAEGPA